jgi:hypothetical protein
MTTHKVQFSSYDNSGMFNARHAFYMAVIFDNLCHNNKKATRGLVRVALKVI